MLNEKLKFSIIIHYSEIGLKKNNRSYFERLFVKNISHHILDLKHQRIRLISARVIIKNINLQDWNIYKNRLKNVMGLSSAILMIETDSKYSAIKDAVNYLIQNKKFESFRVTTKRHSKAFKKTSIQTNIDLGSYIQEKTNKQVKLSGSDLNIIIEILKDKSYIGYDKIMGFGGLPSKSQEKAISLISSGIDSPVASFEMIKRGVNVSYIHFHSYPATSKQSIDNVKELVNILANYQLETTLYCIPLLDIQEKIMANIPDKFWVIFFRRAMLKIANLFAMKNKIHAIITGDSIGQVASQTISNIRAISDASSLPILRPLAGMNKDEIINKAKIIDTYESSIKPYQDCCSYFVPIHPETKAKIGEVLNLDSKLQLEDEYDEALNKIEKFKIKFSGE
jgi:thiamine biosynthesis protein ThiI